MNIMATHSTPEIPEHTKKALASQWGYFTEGKIEEMQRMYYSAGFYEGQRHLIEKCEALIGIVGPKIDDSAPF